MAFNNGPKLVTQGLNLLVDAGDPTSYPGSGTTWRDVVGGQNGTITGSVSYTSSFYGGLVFSGPTASVIFPTSSANFGTSSFTVELAFRPERIQGIHYLISKNSGSFPSWGVYLSGSGGSGKLFSEFRISSTVSCSVSSSTTFVTGSNYDVSVRIAPGISGSGFYVDGVSKASATSATGTSVTTTPPPPPGASATADDTDADPTATISDAILRMEEEEKERKAQEQKAKAAGNTNFYRKPNLASIEQIDAKREEIRQKDLASMKDSSKIIGDREGYKDYDIGGRKMRKSKKSRKSRKSRKMRKGKKSRKMRKTRR